MTPEEQLKYLQPAFLDLFNKPEPDLARFLRLAIDVFDPNAVLDRYDGCRTIFKPRRIVLTSDGSSTIGHCKAESDSGVIVIDN